MQVRKIALTGPDVSPAIIEFATGANILAGQSDTGKSYLFRCLDYILGADELKKRIPQAEPYSQLYVEFENTEGASLTLERSLPGGDVAVHSCKYDEITEPGNKIASRRSGSGQAIDITSVLFPFAGMPAEAKLRKNDRGEVQRLTIRTLLPIFLVNEVAMIDEKSPVIGDGTFDATARKRMFAYLLSGKDDTGIIAAERSDIVRARNTARLGLIEDMIEPLEKRVAGFDDDPEATAEKVEAAIAEISEELGRNTDEKSRVLSSLQTETAQLQRSENQVIAIEEVLVRYRLLDERYASDLGRLDFISEGAHYFGGLQEVNCPLCDQPLSAEHAHTAERNSVGVYDGARAEAAKIKALRLDLAEAIHSLEGRLDAWRQQETSSRDEIKSLDNRLNQVLAPNLTDLSRKLAKLGDRRVSLETIRSDLDQLNTLKLMKADIERTTGTTAGSNSKWEPLPSVALRALCKSIEEVLVDWNWAEEPRVEFDQSEYDIVVDGQSRQSHGKGVRSVLYSAFVIGLLRYSVKQQKPHPGFVVLDSPLTSYRKSPSAGQVDVAVSASVEAGFWASLAQLGPDVQVIVIENKEPPQDVASAVHYEWFGGESAGQNERVGFIPPRN
jgi:hypothetical protein